MKTLAVLDLINGNKKDIILSPFFTQYMNFLKNQYKLLTGKYPTEQEIFYFGYVLSNPMVREKLRQSLPKDKPVLKGDFN